MLNASSSSAHSIIGHEVSPVKRPRTRAVAGVRGRAQEAVCSASGRRSMGKKTPLIQNIGRMNSVKKLFREPIVAAEAVAIIAIEAIVTPMR